MMKDLIKSLLFFLGVLFLPLTVHAGAATSANEPTATSGIQMQAPSMTMQKGTARTLKLYKKNVSGKAAWESSDKKVAAVNSKGKVTAKKTGTATVTARIGSYQASCKIRVINARLSAAQLSLVKGGTKTLTVTGTTLKISWSSSDPAVASVSKKGKVTAKKKGTAVISASVGCVVLSCKVTVTYPIWSQLKDQYKDDPSVKQLLFVKYTGGTRANVLFYTKAGKKWKKVLSCTGSVGSGGIGEAREGLAVTPRGTYTLTRGFGILPDPGAKMSYLKVNKDHYWCGDQAYYNQLVNIKKKPHDCMGEHLIDYAPSYNYGMFLDYNKECVYGKGSAFFLHCSGGYTYTGGCIAVSQPDMIKILQTAEKGAKICIYEK
ncbi:MAG: L,D-transpeptidase family protein [Lachnospiraceae bacterium]|jgi:L,D-peptidoglycan transpeptidase YkuD (ErfK/YbiS/YcfS/YnhG family)|nr:L,D-transpeptidase family protein [Lachnospiraceae bacterium]